MKKTRVLLAAFEELDPSLFPENIHAHIYNKDYVGRLNPLEFMLLTGKLLHNIHVIVLNTDEFPLDMKIITAVQMGANEGIPILLVGSNPKNYSFNVDLVFESLSDAMDYVSLNYPNFI